MAEDGFSNDAVTEGRSPIYEQHMCIYMYTMYVHTLSWQVFQDTGVVAPPYTAQCSFIG